MKEYVDRSWRSETFHKGTEVLLSTKNLRVDLHPLSKLQRRWIGPYKVTEVISLVAYRLDLPPAWRIHPVFYISNLKRFNRSTEFVRVERPPSPIVIEGEEEYEVEGILCHKGEGASRRYLVLWKGYPLIEASREPLSHLKHAAAHDLPAVQRDLPREPSGAAALIGGSDRYEWGLSGDTGLVGRRLADQFQDVEMSPLRALESGGSMMVDDDAFINAHRAKNDPGDLGSVPELGGKPPIVEPN